MQKTNLFKFNPKKDLVFIVLNYLFLVATFYLSFQVITIKNTAGQFITFGIIGILFFGIILPVFYTTKVLKRTLANLGIKKEKLLLSIFLCIGFSIIQYYLTLASIELPKLRLLLPLICMAVTVGLFENIFFRGFVQLKLEESFGIIPAILLSSILYSFYHIGYGMQGAEFVMLLIVGIVYSILFRLTSNIFILFPFLTPMGSIFTNIKDRLTIPFESIIGFSMVIFMSIIVLIIFNKTSKNNSPIKNHLECRKLKYK